MSNLFSSLLTWSINEVVLVLLFIAACGFAGADSGDFKEFVLTKVVALFLFGLACVEGRGLLRKKDTATLRNVFVKSNLNISDLEIIPETESLSEAWARIRRNEIGADLMGAEKMATVREVSKTVPQVGNRLLTVDIIESTRPRKKKITRLRVSEGALETIVKEQGKPIQLALF